MLSSLPATAATFDVTLGLWGDTSTTNSFAWAIAQANATPGADLIRLFSNVNVDQALPNNVEGFLADITDTAGLTIDGNGHSLVGNPAFVTTNAQIITKNFPRAYSPSAGDSLLVDALSFARISDNVANVTVNRLVVDGLNAFLSVGKGSVATIIDSTIKNAVSFGRTARSVITADTGSVVNMTGVVMNKINPFDERSLGLEYAWFRPAILGNDASLNMLKSKLDLAFTSSTSGAVDWLGGTANIVSSVILGQGLSISDLNQQGNLNLVNSIFRPSGDTATARLQAYRGGVANVLASTIQFDAFGATIPNSGLCPDLYPCNGAPLQVFNNGQINLQSSSVSVLNDSLIGLQTPYSDQYDTQMGTPLAGSFSADQYTYIQPVTNQGGASLKLLFQQPNLITSGVAYVLDPNGNPFPTYGDLPTGAAPNTSGPLVNVVPNADSLNQLINPIDQSVILTDVFGNPRTFNGLRDIGAVQTVPGPLPLLGCGAALGWSRRLRRRLAQGSRPRQ